MTAKLNLRRENPSLVPFPTGYLSGRSSAFARIFKHFVLLPGISSFFA
ncbi:hypothetical protein HFK74_13230|nr:hypothetical protein [Pseudomonas sp. SbOxS1]NYU03660.1 hypothetical protein [Pseudomonas sp. SbOxS1]